MTPTTCPTMDELREILAEEVFDIFAADSHINVFPWKEQDERDKVLYRKAVDHIMSRARSTTGAEVRPLEEWHEDMGPQLWWKQPVDEPPYCGTPIDLNWPGYHTHFTPILVPESLLAAQSPTPREKP